jgi:hypothetical protein
MKPCIIIDVSMLHMLNFIWLFYLCRLHAQALTLAALGGSALVEYYDHQSGSGSRVHNYAKQFLPPADSNPKKE